MYGDSFFLCRLRRRFFERILRRSRKALIVKGNDKATCKKLIEFEQQEIQKEAAGAASFLNGDPGTSPG